MPTQTPNFGLNKYNAGEEGWDHTDTVEHVDEGTFTYVESGAVANGDAGVIEIIQVQDGESYEVFNSGLILADGTAAPTNLDLIVATFDNVGGATKEATVIDGDGTLQNDVTTTTTYNNTSGSAESVGLLVDNGQFNGGTGSTQDVAVHYQRGVQ